MNIQHNLLHKTWIAGLKNGGGGGDDDDDDDDDDVKEKIKSE
jgi:hypothetical protein